jgi:hypothetical protein
VKRALLDAGYARPVVARKVYVELRSKVSLAMFDPRAAEGIGAIYELRLGEDRFRAEVAEGRFEVVLGAADRPEATIEAARPPWPHWSTTAAPSRRRCAPGTWRLGATGRRWRASLPCSHCPSRSHPPSRRSTARPASQTLGTSLRPSGYVHVSPFSGLRMYLRYDQGIQTSQNYPRLRCQAGLSNRKNQVWHSQHRSLRSILK